MISIVSIIKSQSMLGSRDYSEKDLRLSTMYLVFSGKELSSKNIVELPCSVSDGHLGYKFSSPSNPHDPIDMGFAVHQTSSASMNKRSVSEKIHSLYDGSTNIDSIFKELYFPTESGEISLHPELDGIESSLCNKQVYEYVPLTTEFIDELKKDYFLIAGTDLLPF